MKLVVGNFKMNLTLDEVNEYIDFFKDKKYENVVFGPTSIYLSKFIDNDLVVTSQDVAFAEKGAYTGDISAKQLKSIGVKYSIVGHSERRMYHNDDKYVNDKLKQLFTEDIIPILCIGETKDERDKGITIDVLTKELDESFKDIEPSLLSKVIVAYEPIWSIGTGVIPTNDDINETITKIKEYLNKAYSLNNKVLYGGSVSNKNVNELEKVDVIDGYLVGGCSIKKNDFDELIKSVR